MIRYSSALLPLLSAALLAVGSGRVLAQGPPPGGGASSARVPEGFTVGYMSQGDVKGLADFVDSTRMLERKELLSKPLAVKHSTEMLKALQISCQLTDAQHIAAGKSMAGGKPVNIGLYEVACANGMGYLLTLRDLSTASGISCLAASATPSNETSDPGKVDLKCRLPANQNVGEMATTVMRNAGTTCAARDVKWLGESAEPKLDYTEVACSDDRGFVLRTPTPGSAGNIDVLTCQDAAIHGAKCQMSAAGSAAAAAVTTAPAPESQARPTLQWFKEALSRNGVACDVKKARIVGRESIKRRYIVEYQCPQQPHGVVAYVPSDGDTVNPFEWIDCDAAATRKLTCEFMGGR
jgi:hypothetical protein